MKRKPSNLDKAISKALHGTRNKVYRLRKKGASDSELRYIDPRKTDWQVSRNGEPGSSTLYARYRKGELDTKGKYELLRQLKDFNERENAYAVTDNGRYISSKAQERFGRLLEGVNKSRKATLDKIIKGDTGNQRGVYYQFGAEGVDVSTMDEWDYKHYVSRDLSPIVRSEPFNSSRALSNAMNTVKNSTATMKKALKKSEHWRKAARNMLVDNGQRELADSIKLMTPKEFLRMITLTDFNARMTDFPYKDFFTREGHSKERGLAAAQEEGSQYMRGLVKTFAPNISSRTSKKARRK